MHLKTKSLVAATAALAVGTAFVIGSGTIAVTLAKTAHTSAAVQRPSARFLADARQALGSYLRTSHPQAELVGGLSNSYTNESYNWSGYADSDESVPGTFTSVSGSWTTPTVKCTAEDTIESTWVGLDGFTSGTVEQDGTIGWCYEGTPTYFTWYEMYPAGTVEVGTALAPGDQISASVSRTGASYTLALTDATNPANSFTENASCATTTCIDTSAEWITERPSFSIGIAPLADFKTAGFTNGAETANGVPGTISSYAANYKITMVDVLGEYDLSTTSKLSHGTGFTNAWKNSW